MNNELHKVPVTAKFLMVSCISVSIFKERPNKRVRLSGYGVELQMKSTEYKVMDDTQVKSDSRVNNTENEDPEEEVEGLNFFKLK